MDEILSASKENGNALDHDSALSTKNTKTRKKVNRDHSIAEKPIGELDCSADDENLDEAYDFNVSAKWSQIINTIRRMILYILQFITSHVIKYPKSVLIISVVVSFFILFMGLNTNFHVEVNEDAAWTPLNSFSSKHRSWIDRKSGYPQSKRYISLMVHDKNGNNLLMDGTGNNGDSGYTTQGLQFLFQAVDTVLNTQGYHDICSNSSTKTNLDNEDFCDLYGVTGFWDHSITKFQEEIIQSKKDVVLTMSNMFFPDGTPVDFDLIYGYPERDGANQLIRSLAYVTFIFFPDTKEGAEWEFEAMKNVLDLKLERGNDNMNHIEVQVQGTRSFGDEFSRAIVKDIPLVPMVFIIMSIFTCMVFMKRHPVHSRSSLGFGAVFSVLLSIMTGYGLMFCIGVPFTSMTQILPFIMFGVGLDDAFIIVGAFSRTDPKDSIDNRIQETILEAGNSIFLTTLTSSLAFGLGAFSSVPTVKALCYYACTTIIIVFLYQVTFFVALLVLDEARVQNSNRDCCFCCEYKNDDDLVDGLVDLEETEAEAENQVHSGGVIEFGGGEQKSMKISMEELMTWYTKKLLRPWTKAIVILLFTSLAIGCGMSASRLTQEFSFTDVLPKDSYLTQSYDAKVAYTRRKGVKPFVYFRFVDQSNAAIQDQMISYVDDLVSGLDQVSGHPKHFWLKDFNEFRTKQIASKFLSVNYSQETRIPTFNEQLDDFLSDPMYKYFYENDIVRDALTGDIITSRVALDMDYLDQENVVEMIHALRDQRQISLKQPSNQNTTEFSFFTFDDMYATWEFYSIAVSELVYTTIYGVIAVSFVAIVLIPHWTSVLFVFPLISILYIDILGVLQLMGEHINAVSYVALVMSIGLMVDFIMHILLRYYETKRGTREERVAETLQTMGASILLGGLSSLLGVLPLAASTSKIFITIFKSFVALVLLGIAHGLILLPVLLSWIGPIDTHNTIDHTICVNDNRKAARDQPV